MVGAHKILHRCILRAIILWTMYFTKIFLDLSRWRHLFTPSLMSFGTRLPAFQMVAFCLLFLTSSPMVSLILSGMLLFCLHIYCLWDEISTLSYSHFFYASLQNWKESLSILWQSWSQSMQESSARMQDCESLPNENSIDKWACWIDGCWRCDVPFLYDHSSVDLCSWVVCCDANLTM
jgi:hypothetical protein